VSRLTKQLIQAKMEAAVLRKTNKELQQKERMGADATVSVLRSKLSGNEREISDLRMELSLAKAEQGRLEKEQMTVLSNKVSVLQMERVNFCVFCRRFCCVFIYLYFIFYRDSCFPLRMFSLLLMSRAAGFVF